MDLIIFIAALPVPRPTLAEACPAIAVTARRARHRASVETPASISSLTAPSQGFCGYPFGREGMGEWVRRIKKTDAKNLTRVGSTRTIAKLMMKRRGQPFRGGNGVIVVHASLSLAGCAAVNTGVGLIAHADPQSVAIAAIRESIPLPKGL